MSLTQRDIKPGRLYVNRCTRTGDLSVVKGDAHGIVVMEDDAYFDFQEWLDEGNEIVCELDLKAIAKANEAKQVKRLVSELLAKPKWRAALCEIEAATNDKEDLSNGLPLFRGTAGGLPVVRALYRRGLIDEFDFNGIIPNRLAITKRGRAVLAKVYP